MKTLILSDLHIGTQQSYGWFKAEEERLLAAQLNTFAHDPSINRIIFAGDVFDSWIYTIDETPMLVDEIIHKWDKPTPGSEPNIIKALRNCINSVDEAWYLAGNHDMFVTQEQLDILSPKVQLLEPELLNQKLDKLYGNNTLHIEHGHKADIFNRCIEKENWDKYTYQGLPLGYFIARLNITPQQDIKKIVLDYLIEVLKKSVQPVEPYNLHQIEKDYELFKDILDVSFESFKEMITSPVKFYHYVVNLISLGRKEGFKAYEILLREAGLDVIIQLSHLLVEALIEGLSKKNFLGDDHEIKMPKTHDNLTIAELKSHYAEFFLLLNDYGHSIEDWYTTLVCGLYPNGLDSYAKKLIQKNTYKYLVLGHTHHAEEFKTNNGIYANNGCWCTIEGAGSSSEKTYTLINEDGSPITCNLLPANEILNSTWELNFLDFVPVKFDSTNYLYAFKALYNGELNCYFKQFFFNKDLSLQQVDNAYANGIYLNIGEIFMVKNTAYVFDYIKTNTSYENNVFFYQITKDGYSFEFLDNYWALVMNKGWTKFRIFNIENTMYLFTYNDENGKAAISSFTLNDNFQEREFHENIWQGQWSKGWDQIEWIRHNNKVYLLTYNEGSGKVDVNCITIHPDKSISFKDNFWSGKWAPNWTSFKFMLMNETIFLSTYKKEDGTLAINYLQPDQPKDLVHEIRRRKVGKGYSTHRMFTTDLQLCVSLYNKESGNVKILSNTSPCRL